MNGSFGLRAARRRVARVAGRLAWRWIWRADEPGARLPGDGHGRLPFADDSAGLGRIRGHIGGGLAGCRAMGGAGDGRPVAEPWMKERPNRACYSQRRLAEL